MSDNLRTRLQMLSSEQRQLLAQRLRAIEKQHDVQSSTTTDTQQLIAFVSGPEIDDEVKRDLRNWLETQVPGYMLPQSIEVLESIPRTETGKIDRMSLLLATQSEQQSDDNNFAAPGNDAEKILASIWEDVLGMDSVSVHDNFFEVGGDSLLSIRILARARQQGLNISAEHFFAQPTIAGQVAGAEQSSQIKIESGLIKGRAPLLPIQHWFFEKITIDPHQWNWSLLLSMNSDLELNCIERAIQKLLHHHDALRLSFEFKDNAWIQSFNQPGIEIPLTVVDLQHQSESSLLTTINQHADSANKEFALDRAPLLRFVLFRTSQGSSDRLLCVIHHLIADGESLRILLEDFARLIQQITHQQTLSLAQKTSSLKTWALGLQSHVESDVVKTEIAWWQNQTDKNFQLPIDFLDNEATNRVHTIDTVSLQLDPEETHQLLRDVLQTYNSQINAVLLTSLSFALNNWTGCERVFVDMEGHGREALFDDIDLSRTIGWFTTVFPLALAFDHSMEAGDSVRAMQKQLELLPANGIGHGLLQYLSADSSLRSEFANANSTQICFNYLGKVEKQYGTFSIEQMRCGEAHSLDGNRIYLLDINAQIYEDCLHIDWAYNDTLHRRETIENLCNNQLKWLKKLITESQSSNSRSPTPDDFPLANLDQEQLDGLSQLLDQIDD